MTQVGDGKEWNWLKLKASETWPLRLIDHREIKKANENVERFTMREKCTFQKRSEPEAAYFESLSARSGTMGTKYSENHVLTFSDRYMANRA